MGVLDVNRGFWIPILVVIQARPFLVNSPHVCGHMSKNDWGWIAKVRSASLARATFPLAPGFPRAQILILKRMRPLIGKNRRS